jgi:hypothetical protein
VRLIFGWGLLGLIAVIASCTLLPGFGSEDEGESDPFATRHLYGVGVTWSDWLSASDLPVEYSTNPRGYDRAQLDLIVAAGGNATHGSFDWSAIEPTQGSYVWERPDQRTEDALNRGLTIYAYIGNTPDWATPDNGLPGYRTPPAEEYAEEFMAYCRAVAARYNGKVEHFFFWNEPNGCSWVNDGCSNSDGYALYTKWLKRAYTAIKEGNPEAIVAAGSLDYGTYVPSGYTYLEGMYANGAKGYFDAFDIHPYADGGLHWQAIEDIRRVLDAEGDTDIPVWVSEYGWADSGASDASTKLEATLGRLASEEFGYVTFARYLVVSDLPGGGYGLVDRNLNQRPIYRSYAALEKAE